MAELVSVDEIGTAAERLRGIALRTPLIPFTGDVGVAGGLVIKPESLQPTGAFKLRGAYLFKGHKLSHAATLAETGRPSNDTSHLDYSRVT